ncbi:hypothetical protein AMECASPLE_033656 [Ameca splendens]|uniref:Uncharacterized protein n=1 Tax=Ameca splendens TaxID=208324 RepID=A0ABV0YHY1_9TELE
MQSSAGRICPQETISCTRKPGEVLFEVQDHIKHGRRFSPQRRPEVNLLVFQSASNRLPSIGNNGISMIILETIAWFSVSSQRREVSPEHLQGNLNHMLRTRTRIHKDLQSLSESSYLSLKLPVKDPELQSDSDLC